ncbi:hypothetical protein, partial [Pseudomonas sp. AH2 (2023)]|uniref:hypothetical protein n=1 Tax=Pseudomonas sp. AH2 (2023) TaxID=3048599 RepID=UPI002B227C46
MYNLFYNPIKPANTWQVTNYAKAFNLSFSGTVQGFYTFESIASFTVTKLTNQKFGLLYVKTDPGSGVMEMTEEWE